MPNSLLSPLSLSLLCSLPFSHHHALHRQFCRKFPISTKTSQRFAQFRTFSSISTSVEYVAGEFQREESEGFGFENESAFLSGNGDLRQLETPGVEVKELEELPEQWRRAKLAWLCKELPAQKVATLVRILNAQRKWMRQEDATYVVVHCTRIRENETAFKVYKWMIQQHWYRFDFALATKLADFMGKERKYAKCREIYDDIIKQGRVPSESTFHILIVAYLSAPVQGCIEEACTIYNNMIQLGGYLPRLSLHNSLFRALVSKPGGTSKHYIKQAEFIYHNLLTCGLEIQKDIYGGLIWLHSYQDTIDKERIASLREEMRIAGIEEGKEVLLSLLRASAKEGDVAEAERAWQRLLHFDNGLPSQAFVYRMEVFAKVGEPLKSLETFREMNEHLGSANVAAYHKIIEVLSKAQQIEHVESLMQEFIDSNMKPLLPSFVDTMNMYLDLAYHDKLESAFIACLDKCRPNRTVYNLYLDSWVKVGNLDKAEEIFSYMCGNESIGINGKSCNTMLGGYLSSENNVKAEKLYDLMCKKKYEIESSLLEKLDNVLSLSKKEVKKPVVLKLSKEQREALIGLLLGGLTIESDDNRKSHRIRFEFNESSRSHPILRRYLHDQFREWLHPSCEPIDCGDDGSDEVVPYMFFTISHSNFDFFADQFFPKGKPMIPKLIHRWLSPRVFAYWYMYGGCRTSSGDILLKLKGNLEGVGNIVKTLKARSLDCKVKRKGRVYWIGFLRENSLHFWNVVEPYILDDLKGSLKPGEETPGYIGVEAPNVNFSSGSEDSSGDSDMDDT